MMSICLGNVNATTLVGLRVGDLMARWCLLGEKLRFSEELREMFRYPLEDKSLRESVIICIDFHMLVVHGVDGVWCRNEGMVSLRARDVW